MKAWLRLLLCLLLMLGCVGWEASPASAGNKNGATTLIAKKKKNKKKTKKKKGKKNKGKKKKGKKKKAKIKKSAQVTVPV